VVTPTVLLPVAALLFWAAPLAVALPDALGRTPREWLAIDQDRSFWLIVIVLIACVGPLFYLLTVRPRFPDQRR
jgi:hypothetical protein